MAGTTYADADAVRLRWPSLPATGTPQADQADRLCVDASIYLRTQYPGLDDQAAADPALADVLEVVVVNMVKRAMLTITPGVSQESSGTGPYSHSVTYSNPNGNLFVTKAEDAMIRGYRPRAMTFSMADDS